MKRKETEQLNNNELYQLFEPLIKKNLISNNDLSSLAHNFYNKFRDPNERAKSIQDFLNYQMQHGGKIPTNADAHNGKIDVRNNIDKHIY